MASLRSVSRLVTRLQSQPLKLSKVCSPPLQSATQSNLSGSAGRISSFSRGVEQLNYDAAIAQCNCLGTINVQLGRRVSELGISSSRYFNAFMTAFSTQQVLTRRR